MAKLSGLYDLSFDISLLETAMSTQFCASEMHDVKSEEGRSKEAASAHMLSYIFKENMISFFITCIT